MRVSAVLGAIVLVLIIMSEAISACRFLQVGGSCMQVSTVLGAIVILSYNIYKLIARVRNTTPPFWDRTN